MATEIIMPKLGLTMTEGTVDQWFKHEGDQVEKGEIVCTISSEKLTHDVEAPESGVLSKIVAQAGEEIPCKEPIAYIGEGVPEAKQSAAVEASEASKTAEPAPVVQKAVPVRTNERIFITPLARKIAAEKGIDYALIHGTGGNGRITRRDVEMYQPTAEVNARLTASAGAGLTGMRKTIAERMMGSLQRSAQVTIHQKADLTNLMRFRKEVKEKADLPLTDGQLSITTLLSRAVILALQETPAMNAWYDGTVYERKDEIHLGIAVALDEGLVVPVIQNADKMTLTQLGSTSAKRIEATRNGTLAGEDYSGSTFTITNLGKSGVEYFTPILNTPEIGILGVGSLMPELAFDEEGQVVQKQKLPLSLTFDHQVVDGSPAAAFLGKIIGYLEHPYSLIL